MGGLLKCCLSLVLTLVSSNALAGIVYFDMNAEDTAHISNPHLCSSSIGAGGNYNANRLVLRGKCEGAGVAPAIAGPRDLLKYVSFRTDPKIHHEGKHNDRAELAYTQQNFPFGEMIYISFRIMIPASSSVTEQMFYPLQLWQCSPGSPIAGLRITRGTSHQVEFMTRGDDRQASFAKVQLQPNVWHQVILSVKASPNSGEASMSAAVDGKSLGSTKAPFGYAKASSCSDPAGPPQHFRLKFGIYKGHEPGKLFQVNFDDLRVGQWYHQVKLW